MTRTALKTVLAAAVALGAVSGAKAEAWQHDAQDLQYIANFREGTLSSHRPGTNQLWNMIPVRVALAERNIRDNACWGPYSARQAARERAVAERNALGDGAQRRAEQAELDYGACMNSFREQISQILAAALLQSVSAEAYLGQLGGSTARDNANARVNLLCDNRVLTPDAGRCRYEFRQQFGAISRRNNPDGFIGAPTSTPTGVALFGPNGHVWTMLNAFSRGGNAPAPARGGAVVGGRP